MDGFILALRKKRYVSSPQQLQCTDRSYSTCPSGRKAQIVDLPRHIGFPKDGAILVARFNGCFDSRH